MKRLRLFMLVLLAVLLPIRGVLAATMLCPQGGATNHAVVVEHGHHGAQPDHEGSVDHAAHHHASSDASGDDSSAGGHPASCPLCASGCCMASIVGTVPPLGQPGPMLRVTFPALTAPVPAFHSGGQDRPPRTS